MTEPSFRLDDKVAIVTGSTRGIGLGIARALSSAGATVVISSEADADTEAVAGQLSVAGIACDVSDTNAQVALIERTVERCGGLDILVCNAGITGETGSHAVADFDQVIAINLRSMVELAELALPRIAARGGGSVLLLSSISAHRGNGVINAYSLAKAGVSQLARNLAVQWGPRGVRVNAISPGLIRTELSGPLLADEVFMSRRMSMTPLRRPGEVEEVAGAAVFLASPAGAFITGHDLIIDGGTVITDGS